MIGSLDSLTDGLDQATLKKLGDPITYTRAGGAPKTIRAYVDHSDKTEALAGTQLTAQDIWIEVLMSDVPQPASGDRIALPQAVGETFRPNDWRRNRDGRMWHIYLAKAR